MGTQPSLVIRLGGLKPVLYERSVIPQSNIQGFLGMRSYLKLANEAYRNNKYKESITLYDKALAENSDLKDVVAFSRDLAHEKLNNADLEDLEYLKRIYKIVANRHGNEYYAELDKLLSVSNSIDLVKKLTSDDIRLDRIVRQVHATENQPFISVIMPTYNRSDIIVKAIRSVIEQSYRNWELLICDDASTDNTVSIIAAIEDERIKYFKLSKNGAAAARNAGLKNARGDIITYLDSDNIWHPDYLARVVSAFDEHSGRSTCYSNYIDFEVKKDNAVTIKNYERPVFNQEALLERNFIDINTFSHKRELYDLFGGFNEKLTRRQDYDLIIKYTWLRDPIKINEVLALYQRNENFPQITRTMKDDHSCVTIINGNIQSYFEQGLPCKPVPDVKKVTVISWDLCRNHFSKPFAVAEALSGQYDVKLISFRFFDEEVFSPLKDTVPPFETVYFQGSQFPEFFDTLRKAMTEIDGDVVYVVKPRMPSLGLAVLASFIQKAPIILEINDLETVVSSPRAGDRHDESVLEPDHADLVELQNPYSDTWSRIMDPIAKQLPVLLTHNKGLDGHFGHQTLHMRNLKDEAVYDPTKYDRDSVRRELGYTENDRVILFGGMLRKHKGIYELVELVERLENPHYKLLFVGSRVTPDQKELVEKYGEQVKVLPAQNRESMARINLAADLVVLWLDPDVPASHYQMPYKATDAFAMGAHVIANKISDFEELSRQGYLTLVPFGDWEGMVKAVQDVFDQPEKSQKVREAARRLFLRQFSYAAARSNFALAAHRAMTAPKIDQLPVVIDFAERFNAFYKKSTGKNDEFLVI